LAAWGVDGGVFRVAVSTWPVQAARPHLADFLGYPVTPLSAKATAGFLSRAKVAKLRFPSGFIAAVAAHLERMVERVAVA
jgi:DNA (cytosine-5)-methyltransferase 1